MAAKHCMEPHTPTERLRHAEVAKGQRAPGDNSIRGICTPDLLLMACVAICEIAVM